MINRKRLSHCIILLLSCQFIFGEIIDPKPNDIDRILEDLHLETRRIASQYQASNLILLNELDQLNQALTTVISIEEKVDILIKKDELRNELQQLRTNEQNDLSKIRYLKGLEIIKILYEKIVSLDHHFASVITFNEISKISNPNNYPEFGELSDQIKSQRNRKVGFGLSNLLSDNIYTTVLHTFLSLFTNSNTSKQQKEKSIVDVECILDFTLRMHNDLNTIYFEMAFLQKSNENIMDDLTQLFTDYTKPIHYKIPLIQCRNSDDWDAVKDQLANYLNRLNQIDKDTSEKYRAHKMRINLEFPIDQLLQFITQYNSFIDQGSKYYEKFEIMLNSYQNEEQCAGKIPVQYLKLKENIGIAIEKFNTAYKPVEINGSKMKEVLYGVSAYD